MSKESLSTVYAVFKGFSFGIAVYFFLTQDVAVAVSLAKDYNKNSVIK